MKGKNEMEFSYENLRNSFQNGNPIGEFWNRDVYAINIDNLCNVDGRYVYVVYDHHNQIILKDGDTWYWIGQLQRSGKVDMMNKRQPYYIPPKPAQAQPYKEEKLPRKEEKPVAATNIAAETNVSINMDIDEILKAARAMTVSSLLDGFNYGLE
jgi:hypothetical protein